MKREKPFFIHKTAILGEKRFIKIGYKAEIWEYLIIRATRAGVVIGENSQIGTFTVIFGGSGVTIGKNVMISQH
jgi:acetyltransferase-like isoleucine patch superfamily enzyme